MFLNSIDTTMADIKKKLKVRKKSPLGNDWCSREFDAQMAKDVGVEEAIMYRNIVHWCEHNRVQGVNFKEGRYWTYRTRKQLADGFSFWTEKQVRRILNNLVRSGYVLKSNFNEKSYDETAWYTYA